MPRFLRRRLAGTLAVTLALLVASGVEAEARDRYPAVAVAPDLASAWTLQLAPGSGVRPGYARPSLDRPARTTGAASQPNGLRYGARRPAASAVAPGVRGVEAASASGVAAAYDWTWRSTSPRSTGRAVNRSDRFDPAFLPQVVDYAGSEAPGTIVIDTEAKFLYRVEGGGKARRYGVGVGKPGFEWAGTHRVSQKREWPAWTPPSQMRAREAAKGRILPVRMDGGPENPLGARAMYLGSSLYRIHGTNQPWTIGQAVSSGCIRMRNEDVMDLYERVSVGTRVIVL
ncbi:hypothetical protein ASG54_15070 [Aureimonas sp. Leaf460]|uniref:L,D-transpeptidase n=2 Tax=unclassified Aureimonas TaxID=2615206 RepID=UPI0006FEDE8D|nr:MULTISPECIES: L,D-transpeptidase [unclassified Aureimonas]KQT70058.1 hypothetical protein ASG62_01150 [Aureimonas sp. Leaf427]KQT76298.1 hypothetical protein ASG54_15070 [Aureimonas sp. Leaf460]